MKCSDTVCLELLKNEYVIFTSLFNILYKITKEMHKTIFKSKKKRARGYFPFNVVLIILSFIKIYTKRHTVILLIV